MYFGLTESKYEIKRLLPISLETRLHIETYKVRSLHSCYEVKGDDLRYRYSGTFSKFWLRELVVYQITNVMTLRDNVLWDIDYVKIMISISHCIKPNEPRIYGEFHYFCTIKTDYRSSPMNYLSFHYHYQCLGENNRRNAKRSFSFCLTPLFKSIGVTWVENGTTKCWLCSCLECSFMSNAFWNHEKNCNRLIFPKSYWNRTWNGFSCGIESRHFS